MSEETVPVVFVGEDQLSAIIAGLTKALEGLNAVQGKTEQNTKELTEEEKKLAAQMKRASDEVARQTKAIEESRAASELWSQRAQGIAATLEIVKKGFEVASAVFSAFTDGISNSLAEWDKLTQKTGKTNSSLGSVADATTRLQKTQALLNAEIGKVIEGSGAIQTGMNLYGDVLKVVSGLIKENEAALIGWIKLLAVDGVTALQEGAKYLAEMSDWVEAAIISFKLLDETFNIWMQTTKAMFNTLKLMLITPFSVLVTVVAELLEGVTIIAEYFEADFATSLRSASNSMNTFAEDSRQNVLSTLGDIKTNFDNVKQSVMDMKDEFDLVGSLSGGVKTFFTSLVKTGEDAKKKLTGSTGTGKTKVADTGLADRKAILDAEIDILKAQQTGNALLIAEAEKVKEVLELTQSLKEIKNAEEKAKARTVGMMTIELSYAQKIKDLNSESYQKALAITENALEQGKLAAEKAKATQASLNALSVESTLMQAQIAREYEGDELKAIALERAAQEIALQQELSEIQDASVRAATEKVRIAQMELEEQAKLKALSRERLDEEIAMINAIGAAWSQGWSDYSDLAAQAVQSDLGNYTSRIEANEKLLEQMELANSTDEASKQRLIEQNEILNAQMEESIEKAERQAEAFQRLADSVGKAGISMTKAIKFSGELSKGTNASADAQEALGNAMVAGAGLASGVAGALVEDVKKRAAIEAAINAAAAIAATAASFTYPGLVPAAIGFGVAATKYGLIASGAFGSSGGGGGSVSAGGGSGGVGMGAVSLGMPNLANDRRENAEAIAEAIAEQRGTQGGIVINVDFGNALISSESPEAARQIATLIAPELERIRR